MILYLFRHGETNHNKQGLVQGWYDSELNTLGYKQVADTALEFNKPVDLIFCSDLKRTQQSSIPFKQKFSDTPYFLDWRIRERNYGEAQNKPKEQTDWEVFFATQKNSTIPGAETSDEFEYRVGSFVSDLRSYYGDIQSALIITHGGTNHTFRQLLGIETGGYTRPQNASITEIEI